MFWTTERIYMKLRKYRSNFAQHVNYSVCCLAMKTDFQDPQDWKETPRSATGAIHSGLETYPYSIFA